jgi:hypothetical protein
MTGCLHQLKVGSERGVVAMNRKTRSRIVKSLLVLMVVVVAGGVISEKIQARMNVNDSPVLKIDWTAPTTGTPVEYYVAEVMVNRTDTMHFDNIPEETMRFSSQFGKDYMVRVAAVDAEGIQGPWSIWSAPYMVELGSPDIR